MLLLPAWISAFFRAAWQQSSVCCLWGWLGGEGLQAFQTGASTVRWLFSSLSLDEGWTLGPYQGCMGRWNEDGTLSLGSHLMEAFPRLSPADGDQLHNIVCWAFVCWAAASALLTVDLWGRRASQSCTEHLDICRMLYEGWW